jgi:ataxin-3
MLYHEKQVAALCGVHCLNTLLQGPYFSEIELAQIAQGLDELERALVGDGALGETSGNVAMDGMFSIQVSIRSHGG